MNLHKLRDPFPAKDIEWRVSRAGERNGKPWARVLAYVTNRAIMDRLDAIVGPENWKNEYTAAPSGGVLCGISVRIVDEWVTKWDGAENTDIESVKGGLSGSMKRAAVQWGIGRYLYNLTEDFAVISDNGAHYQPGKQGKYPAFKWDAPELPAWARPEGDSSKAQAATPQEEPTKPLINKKQEAVDYSHMPASTIGSDFIGGALSQELQWMDENLPDSVAEYEKRGKEIKAGTTDKGARLEQYRELIADMRQTRLAHEAKAEGDAYKDKEPKGIY